MMSSIDQRNTTVLPSKDDCGYTALSLEDPTILVEAVTLDPDEPDRKLHENDLNTLYSNTTLKGSCGSCNCRRLGACLLVTGMLFLALCGTTMMFFKMNCCGEGACEENTGFIGFGACNGPKACRFNSGKIEWGSCNGDASCTHNSGPVGRMSCNGDGSCVGNEAPVMMGSCNGDSCCLLNKGEIENGSCNGDKACHKNTEHIEPGTCNGDNACPGMMS